jgi:aminopeptidase-like protein
LPDASALGEEMMALAREIFPLRRSLTGAGVRETLRLIGEVVPLEVTEIPSGTPAYDWTVPPEWTVRNAWIRDADGRTVVDGNESSLRLLGYSEPVRTQISGAELQAHLFSDPEHPDWIPYRTSYYDRAWGFCVTEHERAAIEADAVYDVCLDSDLESGSLTIAEVVVPGLTDDEILVSTYTCHPSLANDNVSGLVATAALARSLPRGVLRRTHRFLFAPSVIGALSWLARSEARLDRLRCGFVLSCVGDAGPLRWKRSRRGNTIVDRAAERVLHDEAGSAIEPFVPWGGDERQFCSPGFDLAFGSLSRSPHGAYPEYHTSADNLDVISGAQLAGSVRAAGRILDVLDDPVLVGTSTRGEPQLGRRGLYGSIGTGLPADDERRALLWLLNLADGQHTLQDVTERSGLPLDLLEQAAGALRNVDLLEDV